MSQTSFYVNTALVCFNCRRTAVIRLKESRREIILIKAEREALDIVFVACVSCLKYPHIHDPGLALVPRYVESRLYLDQIQHLVYIFDCTPSIDEASAFSLTSWRTKIFTRIYDTSNVFCTIAIPDANIIILENGCEIQQNCQFFRYERRSKVRHIVRYPNLSVDSETERSKEMPFASVARRPPVLVIAQTVSPLCAGCVSQVDDSQPPPVYSSNDAKSPWRDQDPKYA